MSNNPNSKFFIYAHDGYGNSPYITDNAEGEWESLKGIGGEWAEIGNLYLLGDTYQNENGENVFERITPELLNLYTPAALARMPGIGMLTLPITLSTEILNLR